MKKEVLLTLAVLIVATLSLSVVAFGSVDKAVDMANLKDTAIYGRAYTPECLPDCHLVLEIKPGTLADTAKGAADNFKRDFYKQQAKDSSCIIESHYDILVNETYAESVWKSDVKCSDVWDDKNATNYRQCTDNGKYEDVSKWRMVWKPLDDETKPADKAQTYYVDLVAKRKFNGDCARVDAVPTIFGTELKQFAWWNNNWNYYKNITITSVNTAVNNTISVNVSSDLHINWDYSDLRFISDDGTELSYWIEKNTTNFADVWVRIPMIEGGTPKVISMYYGNPAAPSASNGFGAWVFFDDFSGNALGAAPAGWTLTEPSGTSITTVGNLTLYGKAAMIQDGVQAAEPIMIITAAGLTNFRYITHVQLQISTLSADTFYVILDGSTTNMISNKFTETGFYYYNGGAAWQELTGIGAWSQTDWHRIEIKGSTATDKYNITVNNSAQTGIDFRTAGTSISKPKFQSSDSTKGNEYIAVVAIGNYSGEIPAYSFGAEQILSGANLVIHSNTTNGWAFKNGDIFSTNITAKNKTAAIIVSEVNIEFNGANQSAVAFGNDIWNWNTTLSGIPGGTYTIRQFARNGTTTWETNTTTYFDIELLAGLNLSAFNAGNGTALTAWNVKISNGTAGSDYISTGNNNPKFVNQTLLPSGAVSITFYKGYYKNATYNAVVNSTAYGAVNGYLPRYQQFKAANIRDGTAINSFTASFANSTAFVSGSTTTGMLLMGLDELTAGTTTITITTTGYVPNITATTITGSSELNATYMLEPAGLGVSAIDEKVGGNIAFNITIANTTASWTVNGQTFFEALWGNASLPIGDITITLSNVNYGQRVYYATMASNTYTNLTGYLLPTASGSYVRFHTLTIAEAGISGVMVRAYRSISGSYTLVSEQLSDGSGTSLMFLEPITTYIITANKTGYASVQSSIMPSSSDYKIYMSTTVSNITSQFDNIEWWYFPTNGTIPNSTQFFNYTIRSLDNMLLGYGMNITLNETMLYYSGSGAVPTGGSLATTLNFTNATGSRVRVDLWFNKTGYDIYVWHFFYAIGAETAAPWTLVSVLSHWNVCPAKDPADPFGWCLPLNLLAAIVAMVAGGATAKGYGMNGGGAIAVFVLWLFVGLGWFPWLAAFMLTLGYIGVVLLRGGL